MRTRQSQTADSVPGVAACSYFKLTSFSCRYYTQGLYVQTWCHKYSTHPLRPSRPWLQEVVPIVRCQPGSDVEQPQLTSIYVQTWRRPQNRKYIMHHYAARVGPSHGRRWYAKKIDEDRTCSIEDMIADRQTHRHIDTQTDTLITILRSPVGGGVIIAASPYRLPMSVGAKGDDFGHFHRSSTPMVAFGWQGMTSY